MLMQVDTNLSTDATANAKLFRYKSNFVCRGYFNAQFACKIYQHHKIII